MEYYHTSVNWASYVREIFCEFVFSTYKDIVFDGDVEIDESLFGRKVKYNRGNPTGTRIWIFGIVERSSNKIIMYLYLLRKYKHLRGAKKEDVPNTVQLQDGRVTTVYDITAATDTGTTGFVFVD